MNQIIDNEEQLEKMCDKCKSEATSDDKCIRCGEVLSKQDFINPNFDYSKFESNSNNTNKEDEPEIVRKISEEDGGTIGI